MRDPFFDWLAGFIDGEGCFVIARKVKSERTYFSCEFRIKLREDDSSVLYEISERTGIGRVIPSHTYGAPGNKSMMWLVASKAETTVLVEILDRYPLRAKKRRDYEVWREAVRVWHADPIDWPELSRLRVALIEGRKFDHVAARHVLAKRGIGVRVMARPGDPSFVR